MSLSVFEIFKIGIGPSSSHTMGPMNAARDFAELLEARDLLNRTAQVSAQLYGSLALTGRGHCTDRAILLGLEGMSPDSIDSGAVETALQRIRNAKRLRLLGRHEIDFDEPLNLLFHTDRCCRAIPTACVSPRTMPLKISWRARSTTASAAVS